MMIIIIIIVVIVLSQSVIRLRRTFFYRPFSLFSSFFLIPYLSFRLRNDYLKIEIVCRSNVYSTRDKFYGRRNNGRERERDTLQTFTTFAGKRSNPSDVFLEGEVTDGRMIDLAQGDLGWIDWNSTVDGNFPSFFFNLLRPIR